MNTNEYYSLRLDILVVVEICTTIKKHLKFTYTPLFIILTTLITTLSNHFLVHIK